MELNRRQSARPPLIDRGFAIQLADDVYVTIADPSECSQSDS
jgi:hypothetical protein